MLVVLSGVSGAGKDTIKKALIARMDNVEFIVCNHFFKFFF